MSKITLKKNKMMGGMNATLKTDQPPAKRQQKNAVKPPVSALPETPALSALSARPDNNIGIKTLKT